MQNRWILIVAVLGLAEAGCKTTDCGEGTVERDGICEPADEMVTSASCGPLTELQGDECVPMFPPTECDPLTTTPETDPETGVTTCIGMGGGGCAAPLACPAPTNDTKQTLCGRLYNFENNEPLQADSPTGARCNPAMPTADGPCALGIRAFDAIEFAMNPQAATPRPMEDMYIDDCGRWRLTNIDEAASGFIGLGIDDIANPGPAGTTNAVGIATPQAMTAVSVNNLEGFIASAATTTKWTTSAGSGPPTPPSLATGFYVMVFRANRTGTQPQPNVRALKGPTPAPVPDQDWYFTATENTRETIDPAAMTTGANGTAIITGAAVSDPYWTGTGGLPAGCIFQPTKGATLPGVVFISIFRPTDAPGMTCPR